MADTYDLVTLAEGYRALNDKVSADAGAGSYDTILAQWITAISRRIDDVCGPVVNRTITSEQHRGGRETIIPLHRPVSSVSSINEYEGTTAQALAAENLAGGVTTGNDYWLDPDTSIIYRRSSGRRWFFASNRVIVTYVAGRAANTAAVDAKFKLAAGSILHRLWARDAGAWARGGDPLGPDGEIGFFRAVDPMINEFLANERRYGLA